MHEAEEVEDYGRGTLAVEAACDEEPTARKEEDDAISVLFDDPLLPLVEDVHACTARPGAYDGPTVILDDCLDVPSIDG